MIGKRVYCKETGIGHKGTVVGFITGEAFLLNSNRPVTDFAKWNRLFPDWLNDKVIYIQLDKPRMGCTYDEFLESISTKYDLSKIPEYQLKIEYNNLVKPILVTACPVDGIETINNLN